MQDFIFVNLASQQTGAKAFDGMVVGTFWDMRGIKATFKAEELPEYVKNTKLSIASTADESGNMVGLPIDPRGHYHDEDAAGWIVDVEMDPGGEKVRFTPRWTELGIELIGTDAQRFFSPTIDLQNRVIMGGSLTNWPATRSPKGEILLKPVELSMSENTMQLTDGSLDELVNKCKQAFYDDYWLIDAYPVEVFPDTLICAWEDALWRVSYSVGADGEYIFAPQPEWVKVKLSYVEATMKWVKRLFSKPADKTVTTPEAGIIVQGASTMPETLPVSPAIAELTTEQQAKFEALYMERVNLGIKAGLDKIERENQVLSYSHSVVGKGLPVKADELTAFLSSLTPEQCETAETLFSRVVDTGLIPLSELGHSKVLSGTKPLPEAIAASLKSWLDGGMEMADFFSVNAVELGSQADYDLSVFTKQEAK